MLATSLQFLHAFEGEINSRTNSPLWTKFDRREYQAISTVNELSLELPGMPLETADSRLQQLLTGLNKALRPVQTHLIGVWLHGSLATADYTAYSDVDALLVLRDEVLEDVTVYQQVKTAILAALYHVFLFDPLQHHGFFVGTAPLLKMWPAAYLPAAALVHARPTGPVLHPVVIHEHRDIAQEKKLFHNLVQQIYRATKPANLYKAKGLLSQFMLLPAAYCQAMGHPVYKRESFGLVQEQFPVQWQPMEEASRIRQEWNPPKRPFWSLLLSLTNPWLASRLYRPIERQIPVCYHYPNWTQFIQAMQKLAQAMEQKIV